jgi:Transposase DDE domain group 1
VGEELTLFRAAFNRSLRIEARPERLTSEAGAVFLREVIERLGISGSLTERLKDSRDPELITHPLAELLNTSLLLLGQGWRDRDDADTLRDDAVFRLAVSERRGVSPLETREREEGRPLSKNPPVPDGLASQPTLSRHEAPGPNPPVKQCSRWNRLVDRVEGHRNREGVKTLASD